MLHNTDDAVLSTCRNGRLQSLEKEKVRWTEIPPGGGEEANNACHRTITKQRKVLLLDLTCALSLIFEQYNHNNRAVATRVRFQSNVAANLRQSNSFSKAWFSDISAYPIIAILGGATVGCSAFMAYKFTYCPDVRVRSNTKGKVLREW